MIVRMKGGLGNQMFQYAYGRSASLYNDSPLFLDLSAYKTSNSTDTPRNFTLDKYKIKANIATAEMEHKETGAVGFLKKYLKKIKNKIRPKNDYVFDENELDVSPDASVEGYWQSEKYFEEYKNLICNELTLKSPLSDTASAKLELIKNAIHPVSLHIRRGDYVSNSRYTNHHGIASLEYYKKAIKYLEDNVRVFSLFIFSDDIEWAKANLPDIIPPYIKTIFISESNIPDYEELALMSACSHHIIANSSFSWWGAYLNRSEEKVVVAPSRWIADPKINTRDVIPSEWIKI